jgi:hypothetical protein
VSAYCSTFTPPRLTTSAHFAISVLTKGVMSASPHL